MNYARIQKSPRLERALKALQDAGKAGLTTRQWIAAADICACNSIAAEIKANGIPIICSFEGCGVGGSSIFRYTLQ